MTTRIRTACRTEIGEGSPVLFARGRQVRRLTHKQYSSTVGAALHMRVRRQISGPRDEDA